MRKKAIILEIVWNDISTYSGWHSPAEVDAFTTIECRSVGYLVGKTKACIKIAQSLNRGQVEPVGDVTVISLSNVKKIKRLR